MAPLEKVGEEEEEPRVDQAVRDRQLASQKARIVSQMDRPAVPSPRRKGHKRTGSSGGVSEVERRIREMPGPSAEPAQVRGEQWEGLFERIDRTLSYALHAARTTGYRAAGTSAYREGRR